MPGLSVDEALATTRAVRRRLDLDRPVNPELIIECLELALQAPTPKAQNWRWLVVTDPNRRAALAEVYRTAWDAYLQSLGLVGKADQRDDAAEPVPLSRIGVSAQYLADNLHRVPALVIPCVARPCYEPTWTGAATEIGSIIKATWSFMLAARERGLGTCWTRLHVRHEEQAADIVGIPADRYVQIALIPVAHAIGTDFRSATRKPLAEVLHWDRWGGVAPV